MRRPFVAQDHTAIRLARSLFFRQHLNQPPQPLDFSILTRNHIRQIVNDPFQMCQFFLDLGHRNRIGPISAQENPDLSHMVNFGRLAHRHPIR